jgi:hypothetical protein
MIEENDFEYDIEAAADVVWELIPSELKSRYVLDDIKTILELIQDYLDNVVNNQDDSEYKIPSGYPIDIDGKAMIAYIISKAADMELDISEDDLQEIFEAEFEYLYRNGQIKDGRELLN